MKIKKIKILGNGFGGCETTYLKPEEKKGRLFNNEIREKRKNPIHLGLENKIRELRPFLLNLCKVLRGDEDKVTTDYIISETEMISLQIVIDTTTENNEGTGFILEGSSVCLGTKEVRFKTPKIESGDNYSDFDAVQMIIKEIVTETEMYMKGEAQATDSEVLVRWVEKGKDKSGEIDIDRIKGMSPEEQKDLLTKILEKNGSCVIHADELVADFSANEELEGAKEGIKEETIVLDINQKETVLLAKTK
jgi:hypothetical protein